MNDAIIDGPFALAIAQDDRLGGKRDVVGGSRAPNLVGQAPQTEPIDHLWIEDVAHGLPATELPRT